MYRPFQKGCPVLTVSGSLRSDIRSFTEDLSLTCFVLHNVVPFYGAAEGRRDVPIPFIVIRWAPLKKPIAMLEGLHSAAEVGLKLNLVFGGFGLLLDEMTAFVEKSALRGSTSFT
jgi:hypothetical protein